MISQSLEGALSVDQSEITCAMKVEQPSLKVAISGLRATKGPEKRSGLARDSTGADTGSGERRRLVGVLNCGFVIGKGAHDISEDSDMYGLRYNLVLSILLRVNRRAVKNRQHPFGQHMLCGSRRASMSRCRRCREGAVPRGEGSQCKYASAYQQKHQQHSAKQYSDSSGSSPRGLPRRG